MILASGAPLLLFSAQDYLVLSFCFAQQLSVVF